MEKIKQYRITILVVAIILAAIALIILVAWFYGTGFNGYNQVTIARTISGPSTGTIVRTEVPQPGKTLWDWLQLLIIPLALAVIAIFFNRAERKNDQKIATDNQQEAALQEYIKEMSELLLEKDLRKSDGDAEVRTIARIRTLTVLPRLDKERKRSVLKFLYEAWLIMSKESILSLGTADFSRANLSETLLISINLSGTNLSEANLEKAILDAAILTYTNLRNANLKNTWLRADLREADLTGADLSGAILSQGTEFIEADLEGTILDKAKLLGAEVTPEQLAKAKSLEGATMPNGKIYA